MGPRPLAPRPRCAALRALGLLVPLLFTLVVATGCPPPTTDDPAPPLQCLLGPKKPVPFGALIYNGTRRPTHVPLSDAQILAVVGVTTADNDGAFCSGTLISDDVVLTARHCTVGVRASRFEVRFGVDDTDPDLALAVTDKREHEELDLALLRLAEPPGPLLDVQPIPIAWRDLVPTDVGITVEQAGFGKTESGEHDGRYFVTERLWGFERPASYLVVDGEGEQGVCSGDSGGPSMRVNVEGEPRVLGALGWGDYSCVDRDRYARVDVARRWIEAWTGPTPRPTPSLCASSPVQPVDRCAPDATYAVRCQDGLVEWEECAPDRVCVEDGARCIPRASSPCRGETPFGRCDGETLRWCDDDGVPRARDCQGCGEVCALVDETFGAACVPSGCGTLDAAGECDGEVARWCSKGRVLERDCGEEGLTCEWGGDLAGYSCQAPLGCGDLDYTGRCVGDVVEWCEDGLRLERDCADDGETCGFVSDEIGFYCVPRP